MSSSLQIIGKNPGVGPAIDGSCTLKSTWNAYLCDGNEKLGMLYFESLDIDRDDRVFSPVNVKGNVTSNSAFDNEIDSQRETSWGHFLQRFLGLVQMEWNYMMKYTGDHPNK